MPFERLKAIVFADIRDRGVGAERVAEYARAWADSATPGARLPMPCPACFSRGVLAGLKGRSVADGYAAAVCSNCNITFQFSKGPPRPMPPAPPVAPPPPDRSTGAP